MALKNSLSGHFLEKKAKELVDVTSWIYVKEIKIGKR